MWRDVERFNRMVRYEWLSQYYWEDLKDVRLFATQQNVPPQLLPSKHGLGRTNTETAVGHGRLVLLKTVKSGGITIQDKHIDFGANFGAVNSKKMAKEDIPN